MSTPVLRCNPDDVALLTRAAEILGAGGLVAFPTETVYGLGALALDPIAVGRIFVAKGRPANNPLIVHVARREEVSLLATAWPSEAERLAERFWPGPLTLVLPRRPEVPDVVTAGGPTVAVRIPAHPIALRLLEILGQPIAAPSANRSNRLSPTRAEHVLADLDGRIDLILDGGPTSGGIESTVLDLSRRPFRLLRPGLIDPLALEEVIGPVERLGLAEVPPETLPSPGMLTRHYAPRTPLECVEGDATARVRSLLEGGERIGLLSCRAGPPEELAGKIDFVAMPGDPADYAALLYATLHDLDTRQLARIVVQLPPESDRWLGVRDRLRRAGS